ncbi:Mu transposase domain-containing protein [Larkinella sp. VNQ87]|uniref:Mu transposase domain-containing protein n=1 Tax=Larkinella sp. VNQ87 TaxID=3400921 RepID=UPI003C0D3ECD
MKNGHVCLGADKHYYSVPYRYVGRKVKLLYSSSTVEIFVRYQRVALHRRQYRPYSYTTDKEHLASTHRFVADWSPDRFVDWAADIHEDVRLYILKVLERRQHPEQAYRSCMGILSLASKVGKERLTNACRRALSFGIYNYKTIQAILEKGMDNYYEDELLTEQPTMPTHENIRGEDYYR